jgi:sulfonate transport system substrate-binding protein
MSNRMARVRLRRLSAGLLVLALLAGLVPVLPSTAAAAPSGPVSSPQSISYPPETTGWLLQLLLALCLGVTLPILFNALGNRRRNRSPVTSLAREATRLRRLSIGYPEGMTIFEELRRQTLLDDRLGQLGMSINWRSYPSASSLLYDLSQGVIDFCGGGGTASIFAQAAEQLFVRVAREKYPVLDADAILVPEQSSIQILADLRGKRIAFDEGSSAHYVLVRALESAGIHYSEIEPLMLPQREVLPLFEQGLIDAWVVWMPYAPTSQRRCYPGRSIGTLQSILGEQALEELPTLYYAIPELVRDYPRLLKAVLEEVNEAGVIVNQQRLALYRDRLTSSSGDTGPADDPQLLHLERRTLERALLPLDEPTLATLQRQANLFHQLRLIPSRVNVRDGAYSLCMRQNWSY